MVLAGHTTTTTAAAASTAEWRSRVAFPQGQMSGSHQSPYCLDGDSKPGCRISAGPDAGVDFVANRHS